MWLSNGVKVTIKGKEAPYRKLKLCPNKENKKKHKLRPKKCNLTTRDVKKNVIWCTWGENCMHGVHGKEIKKNTKKHICTINREKICKYIKGREMAGPLDKRFNQKQTSQRRRMYS